MNNDTSTIKYNPRFKGYHKLANQDFILLGRGLLNESEFILYTMIKGVTADWDIRHNNFGTFELTDLKDQTTETLDWTKSKFSRIFRALKVKGLVLLIDKDRSRYLVIGLMTQLFEVNVAKNNKSFPDNPFYYIENLITKMELKDNKIDTFELCKWKEAVTKLDKEPQEYLLSKGISESIYRDNVRSYKEDVSMEISKRYMVRDEYVSPDEIPF